MTSPAFLADVEREFEEFCFNCDETANWLAWVPHGKGCRPVEAYVCSPCKERIEKKWLAALNNLQCDCGLPYIGRLTDFFRAIQL